MEELAGAVDFANPFVQRLAFFAGEQAAQLFLACNQFVANGHQHLLALLQAAGGPLNLRLAGGGDGVAGLFGAGLAVMADQVVDV
ncbi:hypothetical protein D3C84_1180890 [compost metagenome]